MQGEVACLEDSASYNEWAVQSMHSAAFNPVPADLCKIHTTITMATSPRAALIYMQFYGVLQSNVNSNCCNRWTDMLSDVIDAVDLIISGVSHCV